MGKIYTDIVISASAEHVWNTLTDFDSYPEWNPLLRHVSGALVPGNHLEVFSRPSGVRGYTTRPQILKVEPNREFRWLGRLRIPFILDGEHIFTIDPIDKNQVRFIHREIFKGLYAPLHQIIRLPHTKRGFEDMNKALKKRAEQTM